jgi:carboxymethylenebutenolidase
MTHAYVARPGANRNGRAVVVGFEMFGITGYVRGVADRIARLGYTAIVPDFYHRFGDRIELAADPEGRARGLELIQRLDRDEVVADVRAALSHAGGQPDAFVGLSLGGHLGYYAATRVPFDAVAVFYPGWLTEPGTALSRPEPVVDRTPEIAAHGTRLLALFGADDHVISAGQRGVIEAHLRDAGVQHELVVYPDTPHGFFCEERDTYRPGPADDAWARLVALLAEA